VFCTYLERHASSRVAVVGGSLPPGVPEDAYRDICLRLRKAGCAVILDAEGAALRGALDAGPLLIKPDLEEAQQLLGRRLDGERAVLEAAQALRAMGPQYVVISLGAQGAIGTGPEGTWRVNAPAIQARSTVGSGDSMTAGLAMAFSEGGGFVEGLRLGTAAGAATAMALGTHLAAAQDVERLLPQVTAQELVSA